ncbi:MAG: glycyl-radical enzyme activating protein, partial [Desulfobacteraceae bacterium]|nr:glycyl-radical enzyme activating protein [Desulfobacteraceae bacterium]
CVQCNSCMDVCGPKAICLENPDFIDRASCEYCFACVDACPSNALEAVGKKMEIGQIVDKIIPYKPFFETSKGGVTLSGGEPTFNIDFLSQLLLALKAKGIHTLIETCGLFDLDHFKTLVHPHADIIYFDLKIADSKDHKKFCGKGNKVILDNFMALQALYCKGGAILFPRIPLIPGVTDTNENITALADFFKKNQVKQAQLIPYHSFWKEKNQKLGIKNFMADEKSMSPWVEPDRIKACQNILHRAGIKICTHPPNH